MDDNAGWFNEASLNVRLGFTRDAQQQAEEEWLDAGVWRPELKTYFHELTHFVQSTTTPYGLFLHYCRQLQTADTVQIVRTLIAAGAEVRRPLLTGAPFNLPGPAGTTVRGGLERWVNTEVLVAFLAQDREAYAAYVGNLTQDGARFHLVSPIETFRRLQGGIAHSIVVENTGRSRLGGLPWDNGNFDVAAINAEGDAPLTPDEQAIERGMVAIELLGNPWGTESILESMAKVSEWAHSGQSLDALRAYASDTAHPEFAMYRNCLLRGLEAIPTDELPQFAYSFTALCEIALQAPLLPQHAALRAGKLDPRELFPPFRFQALLGPAEKARPLLGLWDVGRYTIDLCRPLGWIDPIKVIRVALESPALVADRRAQRYIWAQSERAQMLHAFTNIVERSFDQGPNGEQFRARYAPPVLEYSNKTLFMGDKDALWWLTTQTILTRAMRQVVLGTTLTVPCPYRGPPAEADALTADLQQTLQTLFDRPFPMAKVVMPH